MKKTTKKTGTKPVAVVEPKQPSIKPLAVKEVAPVKAVAPAKVVTPVKAATPAKVAAPATAKEVTSTTTAKPAATTIVAKIDVGFGNTLFVRGQGAGLSWEQGTPLDCVDGKTWRWTGSATDKLTFKLLLNDTIWAQGEDVVAAPGKKVEVSPRF